ncbi:signal peptidase I [Rhodococcus triatomae]|uniref:Signal peptidase I n=1 Tax=Rhodococcus triatomae TaxID=300028 RepID=A0A1G8H5S6_9NOCA|nr:signal peptidase I [Rhodococcus triatomae]QNG20198.1 signal peptidase I [Rhodococcus triatomae]QNG23887.1 signal peptidase I [Rhodococcus triatomae]SDI02002.1 signal peptidase, endoplasmic reticulum-type [Rhodococcus triatomae]
MADESPELGTTEPGTTEPVTPQTAQGGSAPSPPLRRSRWAVVENVVLNVLAAAGVVCIAAVICAVVFNYSLIMFKTGSMSPTIPQGSLALVREIPATDVQVGDVITVDRPGQLPVSHRVIEVHPQTGGEVLVAMQGDDNPNPDPGMYRVSTVREVVWHVPGLARGVVWLSDPRVLASLTIAAAGLVLWAFWPRRDETAEAEMTEPDDEEATGVP